MRQIIAVFVVVAPHVAGAQQTRFTLDAGGSSVRYGDSVNVGTASVAPALLFTHRRGMLAAAGSAARLSDGAWSASGTVSGVTPGPSLGPFGTELLSSAGGSAHRDGSRTGQWIGLAQLVFDRAGRGAWGGGGIGGMWDGFRWRQVVQGTAGVWMSAQPAGAALSFSPTAVDDSIRYSDLLLRVSRRAGRIDLAGSAGARVGGAAPELVDDAVWGSLSVTTWIRAGVGVMASAGTYPVDYTQGFPGGRFVSVGVRLAAPSTRAVRLEQAGLATAAQRGPARTFEARRVRPGSYSFRVHAPGVRRAELMGDFTNWRAVSMTAEPGGWWSVVLPAAPGTYQLNLRFDDGGWRVPPGLVAVTDEFGGAAGLLVLP